MGSADMGEWSVVATAVEVVIVVVVVDVWSHPNRKVPLRTMPPKRPSVLCFHTPMQHPLFGSAQKVQFSKDPLAVG